MLLSLCAGSLVYVLGISVRLSSITLVFLSNVVAHVTAATNLTGIEKPTRPSGKLVEFSYNRNRATFGDIPEQLGGLSNLTRLLMTYNGFNGSIPGEN